MRSIAIVLGDNDFGHTFEPLLTSLALALANYPEFTQEQVTTLIREGVRYHYLAFQHVFQSINRQTLEDDLADTTDYLTTGLRVLFDEQADDAYQHEDHDSGAWHLHVASGQINRF